MTGSTPRGATRDDAARDSGFTLIEVMVTLVLFGIIATIAAPAYSRHSRAVQQQGAVREIVSTLRNVQERALAEDTAFCVDFTATTYTAYRVPGADLGVLPGGFTCSGSGTKVAGPFKVQPGTSLNVSPPYGFAQRNGATTTYALFYARGAASAGSVVASRDDSAKTYTVSVEGLTSRVASTE